MVSSNVSKDSTWYIRQNGVIRGPFTLEYLSRLHERGQLLATTELSTNRREWSQAREFTELFPKTGIHDVAETPVREEPGFHYFKDGVQRGPVSHAVMQNLVDTGQIVSSDLIWVEGSADWRQAKEVTTLTFADGFRKALTSFHKKRVVFALIGVAVVLFIFAPVGAVWYLDHHRRVEAIRAEENAKQVAEQEARDREVVRQKAIQDLEKKRKEMEEREWKLLQHRTEVAKELETIRLQYTTLEVNRVRDQRVESRFQEVQAQLSAVDQAIDNVRAEARQNAEQQQLELERQTEGINKTAQEAGKIAQESKTQSNEAKKQTRELTKQTELEKKKHK